MEGIGAVGLSFLDKDAIRQLPAELKEMGIRRVLAVTDRFLCETGIAERAGRVLLEGSTEHAIYYQVQPNPIIQVVNECLMAVRTLEVDILVAMGDGFAINTIETMSITMASDGSTEDCEGTGESVRPGIPIVAVNITVDTGSKVTSFYIVTGVEKRSKVAMVDINRMIRIVINDIDFMINMPPKLTASTSMDALAHALEAVLSVRATPFMDKDALQAIGTIHENLPKAVSDGDDEEARTMAAYAEYTTGMAFSNAGLGMVHVMVHTLGGRYNLPHGVCNAILLPHALEYSGAAPETQIRFEKIARAMGLKTAAGRTTAAYGSSPGTQTVSAMIETVRQLSRQMETPQSLSLLEPVKTGDFRVLAELAMKDTCITNNTVRPTLQEVIQVYHHAYQGR